VINFLGIIHSTIFFRRRFGRIRLGGVGEPMGNSPYKNFVKGTKWAGSVRGHEVGSACVIFPVWLTLLLWKWRQQVPPKHKQKSSLPRDIRAPKQDCHFSAYNVMIFVTVQSAKLLFIIVTTHGQLYAMNTKASEKKYQSIFIKINV
jgi:hypothetical protein